jgi:squalene-hopene/tetraprenyl-beta-curcumene cyclase
MRWSEQHFKHDNPPDVLSGWQEALASTVRGFQYLEKTQRADGSWLALWFGNQHAPNDENPTYGTSRVLAAYRDAQDKTNPIALRGVQWLQDNQNPDGGWGGVKGTPSSVEETALAVEILLSWEPDGTHTRRGLEWLMERVEDGGYRETSPIGFYFAKLWYFEELYPLIFTVGCLRQAVRALKPDSLPHRQPTRPPALVSQPSVADGTFRT